MFRTTESRRAGKLGETKIKKEEAVVEWSFLPVSNGKHNQSCLRRGDISRGSLSSHIYI